MPASFQVTPGAGELRSKSCGLERVLHSAVSAFDHQQLLLWIFTHLPQSTPVTKVAFLMHSTTIAGP